MYGEITYKRTQYINRSTGEAYCYVDDKLGIDSRIRYTNDVAAYCFEAYADENTMKYIKDHLKNFEYFEDKQKFIDRISELLKQDKIVNIMTDDLEFGPRALGSTTTMALPTRNNVSYINKLNNRNDVMPMAP